MEDENLQNQEETSTPTVSDELFKEILREIKVANRMLGCIECLIVAFATLFFCQIVIGF